MEFTVGTPAAAPADDVPVLVDGALPAAGGLPDGAERNADGTVTLKLAYPVTLSYRAPGGPEVKQEHFASVHMRRLTGRDMRQVLAARGVRASQVAMACASGLSAAKMALLFGKMDASDNTAMQAVVGYLIDLDAEDGLPAGAEENEATGNITLPLAEPVSPDGFDARHELVFRRLRGEDLIAISQAKQMLPAALARGTGMAPREADAVFDAMDAADIMAMQRVVGFLSGSGRRSGR